MGRPKKEKAEAKTPQGTFTTPDKAPETPPDNEKSGDNEGDSTPAEPEPDTVKEADKAPKAERMPKLFFESAGWCPELNFSYPAGHYRPATQQEYDALRKYAR